MASNQSDYPVQFSVDYPERLSRLTTFFRLIMVIPILIVAALIPGFVNSDQFGDTGQTAISIPLIWLPLVLMLVFRHKYPRWWFDWNLELSRFVYRIEVYVLALRDEYPSTDQRQAVRLDIARPNAEVDLNRWLPLIKWFLAIPHYIVLVILSILAFVAVVLGWIMVIITAQYPRALFDFIVGVIRYGARVQAYAFMLTTDRYPPLPPRPLTGSASPAARSPAESRRSSEPIGASMPGGLARDLCKTPPRPRKRGRSFSLSLWERVGVRVFRATSLGLRKGL